jgi:hypothetical protein
MLREYNKCEGWVRVFYCFLLLRFSTFILILQITVQKIVFVCFKSQLGTYVCTNAACES